MSYPPQKSYSNGQFFYGFPFSLALPHIEALNSRSAHQQKMVISPTENKLNSRHLGTIKAYIHIWSSPEKECRVTWRNKVPPEEGIPICIQ